MLVAYTTSLPPTSREVSRGPAAQLTTIEVDNARPARYAPTIRKATVPAQSTAAYRDLPVGARALAGRGGQHLCVTQRACRWSKNPRDDSRGAAGRRGRPGECRAHDRAGARQLLPRPIRAHRGPAGAAGRHGTRGRPGSSRASHHRCVAAAARFVPGWLPGHRRAAHGPRAERRAVDDAAQCHCRHRLYRDRPAACRARSRDDRRCRALHHRRQCPRHRCPRGRHRGE